MNFSEALPKGWKPHSVHWLPLGHVYVQLIRPDGMGVWKVRGAGATVEEALQEAIKEIPCES